MCTVDVVDPRQNIGFEEEKSQHGCVRWALCEHLTSPCHDLACGGLRDDIICLDIVTRQLFSEEF